MDEANGPTAQICQWAGGTRYGDIPEEVRRETVTLLYEQLGGMITSATLPSCPPLADLGAGVGGGWMGTAVI